jgi:hypothetical protein
MPPLAIPSIYEFERRCTRNSGARKFDLSGAPRRTAFLAADSAHKAGAANPSIFSSCHPLFFAMNPPPMHLEN